MTSAGQRKTLFTVGVLLGLVGGLFVGSALVRGISSASRDKSEPTPVLAMEQADGLATRLAEIAEKQEQVLAHMDASLAELRTRWIERTAVPPEEGNQPIEGGADESASSDVPPRGAWVSVLDESLAGVLVERALTPYDPGVAPILREAAEALRLAENAYAKATSEAKELYARHQISVEEYYQECRPHRGELNRARAEVVDKLRVGLDELGSRTGGGR